MEKVNLTVEEILDFVEHDFYPFVFEKNDFVWITYRKQD